MALSLSSVGSFVKKAVVAPLVLAAGTTVGCNQKNPDTLPTGRPDPIVVTRQVSEGPGARTAEALGQMMAKPPKGPYFKEPEIIVDDSTKDDPSTEEGPITQTSYEVEEKTVK